MKLVSLENVVVSLGGEDIVRGVSLEIGEGEMVGLIGPNGAGKTTLMKTIARLIEPRAGSVVLMGKNLRRWNRRELARRLSYMPQGQVIYWPISVRKAVALGRLPHLAPWQRFGPRDFEAVQKAMEDTDVAHLAARPATALAGGEKTLVMLARSLAGEPSVFMADEPVAGLDPGHQIQVMKLLRDLTAGGRSVIVVLHDLTLAARFCQRLYLLKEGKILASGAPADVLNPANLQEGYGVKARYGHYENEFYVIPWHRL